MLQLSLDFLGHRLDRFKPARLPRTRIDRTLTWRHGIIVHLVFRPRARRYQLGLRPDGAARLVIPRRGTEAEGIRFLERSETWLLKRLTQWQSQSAARQPWVDGARFLFRGEEVVLRVETAESGPRLCFSDQVIHVPQPLPDYREVVLDYLHRMAARELPVRTRELALLHGIEIRHVSVRAQKTRWGSCSARGTISLNWRLIQAPPRVVDYLIIHELMHRREMNHSARYWKLVARAFPDYRNTEQWLKVHRMDAL
ncbi:MAG: M48 family metallopeptidase [Methylacidiphilales bacterium]|nr:M48 family metallopeptidase [Candidatus Methylacidiphilales bacterium]